MKTVYLAGPISGVSFATANSWRRDLIERFANVGIEAKSPLRNKEYLAAETSLDRAGYSQPLSRPEGIVSRDRMDCTTSDVVLMNLLNSEGVSIGSMIELGWADGARRPIVVVMEPGQLHDHGMVRGVAGYVVDDLDTAYDIVCSILNVGSRWAVK